VAVAFAPLIGVVFLRAKLAHKESGPGRVTSLASPANSCREIPAMATTRALNPTHFVV
jgi:hypothetical protein